LFPILGGRLLKDYIRIGLIEEKTFPILGGRLLKKKKDEF